MDVLDDFVGAVESDVIVLDDDRPDAAGRGRDARLSRSSTPRARSYNVSQGAFVALAAGRRRQGARRRAQLRGEPVQPRDRGAPPARLVLQALRLSRRPRARPHPRHRPRRFAGELQGLDAGKLLARPIAAPVTLRDALALSLNTVAVKLGLEVGPEGGRADRAAPRHRLAAAGQSRRSRSAPPR